MKSRLYRGNVGHERTGARAYRFSYGVYYLCVDLDEVDQVDRRIALLSHNRANVLSLMDRDHAAKPGHSLAQSVRQHLADVGVDATGASIELLTNTRVLGYVFNPVSFYFVREPSGGLRHVVAEVHNTHGERHLYDLVRSTSGSPYESSADKRFYVSPFIDMEGSYAFRIDETSSKLRIGIDEFRDGERFFRAHLALQPVPLTNANVARMLARYPLVTLKTTAMIHWQGLKLWLRGERYRPNPSKAPRS